MKVLVLTGGSPATVFALAPLATAARLHGHEVLVASPEEMVSFVSAVGLPTVPVTDGNMRQFMFSDRDNRALTIPKSPEERLFFNGRGFGRFAAASLPALRSLVAAWAPDLVVGGSLCYAAPLIAAEVGVSSVRHTWDLGEPPGIDVGAADELGPELSALGLAGLPEPGLWVDICPPSLRDTPSPGPRQSMRFIPYNEQRALKPWMYRSGDRPRVCVTAGSRVSCEAELTYLQELVDSIADLDVELVVAAPGAMAEALKADTNQVRTGWFPLDVLLNTCDLIVHHGGGQTSLTALNAGVPQLLIPNIPKMLPPCGRISARGAAITLPEGRQTADQLRDAVEKILRDPAYRAGARAIREEIAAQPVPAEVVARLEALAHGYPGTADEGAI